MSNDSQLRRKRQKMADAAGEGAWFHNDTKTMCLVDVSFYPSLKRWITENGKRREISKADLEKHYHQLIV